MKVIFVGVHNKPGLPALCSTTKTGKIIDRIIEQVDVECEKRNLFPVDYMPYGEEREMLADQFEVEEGALYVGLGKIVCTELRALGVNFKPCYHPSFAIRQGKQEEYIEDVIWHLNEVIPFNH